mgnify:CR=1 FL=1
MAKTALIAGVTGIQGSATADRLIADGWTVYGLARNPSDDARVSPGYVEALGDDS